LFTVYVVSFSCSRNIFPVNAKLESWGTGDVTSGSYLPFDSVESSIRAGTQPQGAVAFPLTIGLDLASALSGVEKSIDTQKAIGN
jgi:hypothetical protein